MTLRPKTKVRLILILVVCLSVGGSLGWIRHVQVARETRRVETLRKGGMAAYGSEDYATAVQRLGEFFDETKVGIDDANTEVVDALYALADSRSRMRSDTRGKFLSDARERLECYRAVRPGDPKALHLLIKLDERFQRHADVIRTADQMLAIDPNDSEALLAKAKAMLMLPTKPPVERLKPMVDRLLAIKPRDLRGLLLALEVKKLAGATPDEIIAEAARDRTQHPGEAVYDLVFARAALFFESAPQATPANAQKSASRLGEAKSAAIAATKVAPPDYDFALQLINLLEHFRAFPQAVTYARVAVDSLGANAGQELPRALMQRLWQSGEFAEVLSRTSHLDPRAPRSDCHLLAYRALSILGLLQKSGSPAETAKLLNEFDPIFASLASRKSDFDALAWSSVLQADQQLAKRKLPGAKPPVPAELVSLYNQALERDPKNFVAVVRRGDVMSLAGEEHLAVRDWKAGQAVGWGWAYPLARLATLSLQLGQATDGIELAMGAVERQPNEREYQSLLLQAQYLTATNPGSAQAQPQAAAIPPATQPATRPSDVELLNRARELVRRWPTDANLLAIEVDLTARVEGSSSAAARAKQILSADLASPTETFIQLQAIDSVKKLGLSAEIEAAIAKTAIGSRFLALHKASELLASGDSSQAIQLLSGTEKKLGLGNDSDWLLSAAALRDRAEDPGAAAALAYVADRSPQDISVQLRMVQIPGLRKDRELWRRTIDRVHTLCGDETTRWKSERGQWILAGNASPTERKDAIQLLAQVAKRTPDSVEAHRLLGKAYAADGQYDRAINSLTSALQQWPRHPILTLELAEAYRLVRRNGDAVSQLALLPNELTTEHALRAAQLYEQSGRVDRAIDLLARQPRSGLIDVRLGRLLQLAGRVTEADAAYRRSLNDEHVAPRDLLSAAEFFATRQQPDFATLFLDRLRATAPSPATAEVLLGQFDASFGTVDSATGHFREATRLDAKVSGHWTALAGHLLRAGKIDEAEQALGTGLKSVGTPGELTALKSVIRLARRLPSVEGNLFVRRLSVEPQNEPALAVLTALAGAQDAISAAKSDPTAQTAALVVLDRKLMELADANRDFWLVQQEVIGRCLSSGRPETAATLAARAMQVFPNAVEPAALAATAYQRCGRWAAGLEAAEAWRLRAGVDTLPAEVMIASLRLSQRRGDAKALDALTALVKANPIPTTTVLPALGPTTRPATQSPGISPVLVDLHRVYGQALVEVNRVDDAVTFLKPMLESGDAGWQGWLGVSGSFRDSAAARRWIELAESTAANPSKERTLVLAQARMDAAESTADEQLLKQAVEQLDGVLAKEPKSVEALISRAVAAHQQRQYAKAADCWRAVRALSLFPSPDVANNLAYALLMTGDPKAVDEAKALAVEAVKGSPDSAVYLCTLAKAQASDGRASIATYRQALANDSELIEAIVGLADGLTRSGNANESRQTRELIVRARSLIDQGRTTSIETRGLLRSLETGIGMTDPRQ